MENKDKATANNRMQREYLVDICSQKREHEAIQRFLELPFTSQGFFGSLGLIPSFSWYLLQIRKDRLVCLSKDEGDVDILAGRLSWSDSKAFESVLAEEARNKPDFHPSWHYYFAALKLADSGGIKWPPLTDYLVGIEAKCAYLNPEATEISENAIKSTHRKVRKLRAQVKSLLQMGFNRVALLDIIANPPVSGPDSQAWLVALNIAIRSRGAMFRILEERLPEDSPAGHWAWSIGSVIGGDETMRGAGSPIELRTAHENPFLQEGSEVLSRRQEMESKLSVILAELPSPCRFPVIFIDCRTCGKIHRREDACNKA